MHIICPQGHLRNQTIDRNVREIFMFSSDICQIVGNIGVHKAFVKCASENSIVNVKLMERIKTSWAFPMPLPP
jgi:hypothetical protein